MRHNLGLRQLSAIVAIADSGGFSAAALLLHVSQPALSRTIRLAEESLGAKIFERDTRTLSLTPAGAELLPIARRVTREFTDSMSDLAQFMEGRRGRVRVSALPSMAQSVLVDALVGFTKLHPQVEFLLRVDPADKVLSLLENRDIEVGLTVQPPPDGRFSYTHLHEDEFVLICRQDDALATLAPSGRALPWTVLRDRPVHCSHGRQQYTQCDGRRLHACGNEPSTCPRSREQRPDGDRRPGRRRCRPERAAGKHHCVLEATRTDLAKARCSACHPKGRRRHRRRSHTVGRSQPILRPCVAEPICEIHIRSDLTGTLDLSARRSQ